MQALLNRFFYVAGYDTELKRTKARLIYGIVTSILLLFLVYAVVSPDWYTIAPYDYSTYRPLIQVLSFRPEAVVVFLAPFIVAFLAIVFLRNGRLTVAAWITQAMLYVLSILPVILLPTVSFNNPVFPFNLGVFIVVGALLNGVRGLALSSVLAYFSYLSDLGQANPNTIITTLVVLTVMVLVAYQFDRYANINRIEGEKIAGQERVKLAEITTQLTRLGSQRVNMDGALNTALKLIQENYPQFYHVQIFIIEDSGVQARLTASTGTVGQQLLARQHSLAVGSLSVIGQTTFKGLPVIVDETNTNYRPNELLPNTKLEAAFPISIGNKIIGALDMQSLESTPLTDNDTSTFQSLADSLALVIDNIRQFENARVRVEENQLLAEQARGALAEVQRLNKRLIGRAWAEYLKDHQDTVGMSVDFTQDQVQSNPEWTPTLRKAVKDDTPIIEGNTVAVPLRVRGQIIGAMEIELDKDAKVTVDDIELMQEISDRFGMAAENTRLVEQSQRAAQREALINVISSRLQTANNVESTLAEAARSLSELLQAERVVIRLGKPNVKTAPIRVFGE